MIDDCSLSDRPIVPAHVDLDLAVARAWQTGQAGVAPREDADAGVSVPLAGSAKDNRARGDALSTDLGPIALYLQEIRQVPLLQPSEEIALARALEQANQARAELARTDVSPARRRDLEELIRCGERARQQMTEANLRLVVSIARKYLGRGLPLLDLIQEGNLGLARAVEKYDHRLGYRFSTYASWWIREAVSRALADQARAVRLPVYVDDQIGALARTRRRLEQELGRDPTVDELAQAMAMTPQKVCTIAQAAEYPLSLEAPVDETGETRLSELIEDTTTPTPIELATQALLRDQVEMVLGHLPERQRRVVQLRFGLTDGRAHTREEVGRELGLTRERVHHLEDKALRQLRSPHLGASLRDYY